MIKYKSLSLKSLDLSKFDSLEKAAIDASSIIYIKKAGFLNQLSATIQLLTLGVIIDEVREPFPGIEVIPFVHAEFSNDRVLVELAREKEIPVISEDRQLLMQADRMHLDYYNAMMMMLFLLYKRKLEEHEYQSMYSRLIKIARYSDAVIQYVNQVCRMIQNTRVMS